MSAFVLGSWGDHISSHWERVHDTNAAYQKNSGYDREKSADEIAKSCENVEPINFRDCIRKNLETYYQDQAANIDLQAQQEMAFWAFWLFVSSVLGIIISAFGVLLLIRSLSMARSGNKAAFAAVNVAAQANEIAKQQNRPWIVPICSAEKRKHDGTFGVSFCAKNSGNSPAMNVEVYAVDMTGKNETADSSEKPHRSAAKVGTLRLMPNHSTSKGRMQFTDTGDVFFRELFVLCQYKIGNDGRPETFASKFIIAGNAKGIQVYDTGST
jgi:hypothetical protein